MNTEVKGIAFPFQIGGRGGVVMSGHAVTGQQHIKEGIMALFGTMEFERVMKPYFGLEELDIFFNDLNETTKNMAIFKIREKLEAFEPRIEVIDIQINSEQMPEGLAHIITMSYALVDSGEVNQLAFNV